MAAYRTLGPDFTDAYLTVDNQGRTPTSAWQTKKAPSLGRRLTGVACSRPEAAAFT